MCVRGVTLAGVYDVTIELQKWPHLEDHAKKAMSSILLVQDIMTQNPIVFREVMSHQSINQQCCDAGVCRLSAWGC